LINNEAKKRIIAIDYGTKRVGVAISDPFCIFPSVTITIQKDENFFRNLLKLIAEKNVGKIILGYPDSDNGKTSRLAEEILKFKFELENKLKIEIDLRDEHLTSQMAASRIIETVSKKSKRRDKSKIDAQAAAILLEEYLNSLEKYKS
jgi:putative holliday junction resolvase